ncbi:TOBE domain-containing protein [Marinobacterium aestuariivivens]|uniref:TOBE domain-containing protein n=1 Tax=Marinobacterium aestuariivivens TaxID=1698799 RepID=A0ABW1ZZU4_9GAMM
MEREDVRDNRLAGTLAGIERGTEFDEYRIELDGGEPLCALVPRNRAAGLSFKTGDALYACFAPDQVILATLG